MLKSPDSFLIEFEEGRKDEVQVCQRAFPLRRQWEEQTHTQLRPSLRLSPCYLLCIHYSIPPRLCGFICKNRDSKVTHFVGVLHIIKTQPKDWDVVSDHGDGIIAITNNIIFISKYNS